MDDRFLKRLPGACVVAAAAALLVWVMIVATQNSNQLTPLASIHRTTAAMVDAFDASRQPVVVQDRIIDLPEDGSHFYLTVFLGDNWKARPRDREIAAWFDTHPALRSLRTQTHFTILDPSSRLFQTRWPSWRNSLPAVMLQQGNPHTGRVCYKVGPAMMPVTADELALQLDASLDALRICPRPTPRPTPVPVVVPVTPEIPDVIPQDTATPSDGSAVAVIIAVLAGIVALFIGVVGPLYDHIQKAFRGQAS